LDFLNQRLHPGCDYQPGVYTVALLKYQGPAVRSVHNLTYSLQDGTTIGTLVDKIIALKMHHFLFLPYTREARWKGYGDHLYVLFHSITLTS